MSCQQRTAFAAGALAADAADDFRDHLADCASCQGGLLADMQLDTRAAAAGHREQAAIRPLASARRSLRWPAMAAVAAVAAVAAGALLVVGRRGPPPAVAIALADGRSVEGRLSSGSFDRHRPYAVDRAAAPVAEPIAARALADLEAAGDLRGLAAGQLLGGNRAAASAALAAAPASPDTDSDRALLALVDGRPADAVLDLDAVLAAAPDHPQARWNLGLAYRDLGLPLMSAAAFARVASRGEPGWSAEAAGRADGERATVLAFGRDYQRFYDGARAFAAGTGPAPEPAQWRAYPGIARLFFYDALRATASRDRLAVLAAIAAGLDADSGGTALAAAVTAVTAGDAARRAPLAARYAALLAAAAPTDGRALIADARRAGAVDIALGAMVRAGDRGRVGAADIDDYRRLAAASPDPWMQTLAVEQHGLTLAAAGRWPQAAAELRLAAERCTAAGLDYRCARVSHALADGHLAAHEISEARRWSAAAARFAARAHDWHLQLQLLFQHAEIEHFADDVTATGAALVRAHLGELLARAPTDCSYAPYAHTLLGTVAITQLDPVTARREHDLSAALHQRCGLPLPASALFLAAQVLGRDGRDGEVAAARTAIDALRGSATAGSAALLDHIEGRLLLRRGDRDGQRLLTAAIAAGARAGDLDGAKARAYSYALLAEHAAVGGDAAAAFALVADEIGATAADRCAVAVLVDDQAVAIVRDADGAVHAAVTPRRPGPIDAATLVPAPLVARLAACAEVEVIARSPIHGRARLLPPTLVWAYHGGRHRQPAAASAGVRLVVADVAPPAELRLPRLASHRGVAGDVALTGAAATPARVLAQMADADHIEIHAHGIVDCRVADGAYLALSPDADGSFALTARQVRAVALPRRPVVVLGACDAGLVAPYFHTAWSLPSAFIAAGARAVIASTAPVPDADAGQLFAEVSSRIRGGASAARALHDVRRSWRTRPDSGWLDAIVVFE